MNGRGGAQSSARDTGQSEGHTAGYPGAPGASDDPLAHRARQPAGVAAPGGDQAQLKSKGDDAGFTTRQADLDGDEVRSTVEAGRQATKIAITLEGQASLVLQDDFTFKSLRFDEALIEEANNAENDDDAVIRLETDFVLMADALAHIIEQMLAALGGEAKATPASNEATEEEEAAGADADGQAPAADGTSQAALQTLGESSSNERDEVGEGEGTHALADPEDHETNSDTERTAELVAEA